MDPLNPMKGEDVVILRIVHRKVSVRDLCAALERDGFVLDRQRDTYHVYYRSRDKRRVVIPYHRPGATLSTETLFNTTRDLS